MAQNEAVTTEDHTVERIRFVTQYPKIKVKEDRSMSLSELILGRKPDNMVKPMAIIAEGPADLLFIDQAMHAVLKVDDDEIQKLKAFRKNKEELPSLIDACRLPNGTLLITDSQRGAVLKLDHKGKKLSEWGADLELDKPTGIAYSAPLNQVWLLETGKHRVVILDLEGNTIATLGDRGNEEGNFNYPTHIWIDGNGQVYIVDSMNFRVQIFDKQGEFKSMFGQLGDGAGNFARQKGIATDSHNNIYVVDALFNTVQIFDQEGRFLHNFGSQGRMQGEFWLPTGIFIDDEDHIYVADSYNRRIQVFQLINGHTE